MDILSATYLNYNRWFQELLFSVHHKQLELLFPAILANASAVVFSHNPLSINEAIFSWRLFMLFQQLLSKSARQLGVLLISIF